MVGRSLWSRLLEEARWWQLLLTSPVKGGDSDVGVAGIAVAVSFGLWSSNVGIEMRKGMMGERTGYGIHSIRVDGNDDIVVFTAVQEARKIVVNEHKTVLVEALRKQSRLQAKQNAGVDKRHQYKGKGGFQRKH
ncbi:hypothetical protein CQW23_10309 [Capsicum baccatum]|uniref:Dehydrogenase E1 component domain-containing protein n=1 Tax=Capsicum baccatum TaxID=33114 RepID=A0A2G2WZ98_CAPBA|nr:hypothetical protein CQW23_10309 [Capsicum baccatum]